MIPDDVVETINDVRFHFLEARRLLHELPSFQSLEGASEILQEVVRDWDETAMRPHVQRSCDGRLVCAIIGSSGHGKTTLLDEMFPGLSERGWLVTDVTDTTAQALRIEYADPDDPDSGRVVVSSWDVPRLKELMSHPEVVEQNEQDGIQVRYHEDGVVVDGREATLPADQVGAFRFDQQITLEPFSGPWEVPPEKVGDQGFIRALTVKEQSEILRTEALVQTEGKRYDALQLRALVKDVALKDSYQQLGEWAPEGTDQVSRLVFVDTPGLAVRGSAKDEILRHFLERKSLHVALDLWREDELDLVVHLVLNGRQSDFAALVKEIERVCGPGEVEALAERLVLAVNGANIWFTNRDIKAKYEDPETTKREGDQFQTTLEDNVLQKMSPRGTARPARVAFLDSRGIVETLTTGPYEDAYARYRPIMERWLEPDGPGRSTLERLGLLESFRENVDALCDPSDRGQGFLLRQVLEVGAEKGPQILIRKHLVKTGLIESLVKVREALARFYDGEGRLNQEGVRTALESCMAFLDGSPSRLESFAKETIDPRIPDVVPAEIDDPHAWPRHAFEQLCGVVREEVLAHAGASPQAEAAFTTHVDSMTPVWAERFGWQDARLVPPEKGFANTADLVAHGLSIHAREMLHELGRGGEGGDRVFEQTPEDRQGVAEVLQMLETATAMARGLLREHGVGA